MAKHAGGPGTDAIVVRDLHVRRAHVKVLHGLSLDVPSGRVIGLLGPSGSGKTTLMRSIVGVQVVDSGTITVLGLPAGSAPLRRRVAYVTQQASVYDDLTVRQNLAYFARVLGAPSADVDRVIGRVHLGEYAGRLAGSLSGGQRGRVSLAAALLGQPEVLVLDEPTVGLDPVLRVELWSLFHALAAEGATLLVSSHVMDEAKRCDRLLLMRNGELLADDTVPGVLEATGTDDIEDAFLSLIEHGRPDLRPLGGGAPPPGEAPPAGSAGTGVAP
ncbi:ABC transporter ATP-binding protein [Agromyces tardus]|jgi:ABC-2 type transport system ATP-binding protein|uniref:ABC transporter ATP-binding protein n=1 Tax=Agromyces tardus TaxID=2583849 RepID=A0A3M8AD36_9MICO|nr:ABC transporter ATP-binding protein [Agromyces tardus]RNB49078.1 ABC transporter ATP-binding protein [Agromyces tardus]